MKYVVHNNNKFEANLRFKNCLIGDIQKESYRLLGKNLEQLMSNKMNDSIKQIPNIKMFNI